MLIDFLLYLRGVLLRAAHGDQAMRAENILKQKKGERQDPETNQVPPQETASSAGRLLCSLIAWWRNFISCSFRDYS